MGVENSQPIIKIENLNKNFITKTNTITALENINLEIFPGEIFGIIGLSGAGKSTLVRCMNQLERPTSGDVIFDGKSLCNIQEGDLRQARRSMGMIFQQFNLLMQKTALKNVCFPLELIGVPKSEAKSRAMELLELVGLGDRANAYPVQLSGGQMQRVAIARALATNPKVLLCDEATSALDPTTTRSILALIKEINQKTGITVVIITHEMSVIEEICNKVAIIDKSNIAEAGEVSDVFSNPRSEIAKRLIFSGNHAVVPFEHAKCYRIIFDGRSSFEPVISNMVLECKTPVNIMFADTRNIDGKAFGQMIIQLPQEGLSEKRVLAYLDQKKIKYEEVSGNV